MKEQISNSETEILNKKEFIAETLVTIGNYISFIESITSEI